MIPRIDLPLILAIIYQRRSIYFVVQGFEFSRGGLSRQQVEQYGRQVSC